ncbi:uncharacterized protein LOC101461016 isoform X1 [Ceratitis capitata]|uniref:uncharacterized protein LOC101461016 isoform X1 n=1 Tax=Ceratitis capitata TaxID=7213 RepID=UPI0006188084|nr:uncharacterized protein LOC101461016 isoform X1 [Ceratitis capitata]
MKFFHILLLTLPLLAYSYPAQSEEKSISLEEVELPDSDHAASGGESQIQKRSGSFDYVAHLKSGLLSSIGQASASIASGSSGGSSSSGGDGYKSYESAHGNSVDYNPWTFKKSVLNTIFQAVKAITGGVTALKGQLIKGSGYALSASGNLVASSGDKVTDVGKAIINSAQINSHSGYGGGGVSVHPFAKFSSLSGASSGGSSGGSGNKHSGGPVVHTETITTYEIPPGHSNYGPPSKPPTYSSATHQYLPPATGGYTGGGAPFSSGHAAFEAPASNYLPTGYSNDGHDDFNIYGRHQKLSDTDARKAAAQLQEILSLLPSGKTEFTASKTIVLDTHNHDGGAHTGPGGELNTDSVDLHTYGLPKDLGPLESLSHTESITAAYAQRQQNPADIYRQMAKKQTAEEIYIQKHPNEGYDYRPTSPTPTGADSGSQQGVGYKYNNYHATNNALKDLTPIIAALEVAKRRGSTQQNEVTKHFTVEKSVYKVAPQTTSKSNNQFKYLPPTVHKTKHIYFDPAQNKADTEYRPQYVSPAPLPPSAAALTKAAPPPPPPPAQSQLAQVATRNYGVQQGPTYSSTYASPQSSQHVPAASSAAYKVRRQVPSSSITTLKVQSKTAPYFKHHDYEIQDPLMFNRMLAF